MLSPFSPVVPLSNTASYDELTRAAKSLRVDPAGYRPIAGIEYGRGPESLYRWEMESEHGLDLVGLLGIVPLDALIPHESTTAAALTRPRHPIQIRPVMALVDGALPDMEVIGPSRTFAGRVRHTVTPVTADVRGLTSAVIADGHHRTAAAIREGGDPGIMALLVGTETATLTAGAFHRVFAHPAPISSALSDLAHVIEAPADALAAGRIAIVSGEWDLGVVPAGPIGERYAGIPAGWVHHDLLPRLGLDESDAVYLDDVPSALAAARYGTAILLPGSDVDAVVAAARSGLALPPKATRFRPKPLRGFMMRAL
jgi:hypothetical protein